MNRTLVADCRETQSDMTPSLRGIKLLLDSGRRIGAATSFMFLPSVKRVFHLSPIEDIPPGSTNSGTTASSLRRRIGRGFLDRLVFTAIWLPAGALGILAKIKLLSSGSWRNPWVVLAHSFHRVVTFPAEGCFTFFERISLFSSDWLVGFAVVPLLLVLFLAILPRRLWAAFVLVVSILTSVLVYLQIQSLKQVGHYIPWYLISDAAHWAVNHPQFAIYYSSRRSILEFALFVAILTAVGVFLQTSDRLFLALPVLAKILERTIACLVFTSILFGMWGMSRALAKTWYGRAEISVILSATFAGNDDMGSSASLKSSEALRRDYAVLADSKAETTDLRYWAKANGFDVIVFILETAPARYDSFESLDDLPTLKQLAKQSWIGTSHYSTFPYTAKATFSILTSMYPPNPMFFGGAPRQAPGLVRALTSAGYQTLYYVPHSFESNYEDDMYAAMGFGKIFTSPPIQGSALAGDSKPEDKIQLDLEALHALLHDTQELSRKDRRYLAVFSPQIGHGPFPDVLHGGRETLLGKRVRGLLELQDAWLGEIVDQLAKDGRLDRTIIVVTGDHGVRTEVEDPSFEPDGLLPDYSFHVPLLIFAPQVLSEGQEIGGLTSHIDLAPTVLDLLGVKEGREFEQGLPVWDRGRDQRRMFLWAGDYLGAEGFIQGGDYTVWNKVTDFVFEGSSLDEEKMHMTTSGSEEQIRAVERLRAMEKLDGDWWISAMPSLKAQLK